MGNLFSFSKIMKIQTSLTTFPSDENIVDDQIYDDLENLLEFAVYFDTIVLVLFVYLY